MPETLTKEHWQVISAALGVYTNEGYPFDGTPEEDKLMDEVYEYMNEVLSD